MRRRQSVAIPPRLTTTHTPRPLVFDVKMLNARLRNLDTLAYSTESDKKDDKFLEKKNVFIHLKMALARLHICGTSGPFALLLRSEENVVFLVFYHKPGVTNHRPCQTKLRTAHKLR